MIEKNHLKFYIFTKAHKFIVYVQETRLFIMAIKSYNV